MLILWLLYLSLFSRLLLFTSSESGALVATQEIIAVYCYYTLSRVYSLGTARHHHQSHLKPELNPGLRPDYIQYPNVIAAWVLGFLLRPRMSTSDHSRLLYDPVSLFRDLLLFSDPFYSPTTLEIPLLLFGTTPDGSQRSVSAYTHGLTIIIIQAIVSLTIWGPLFRLRGYKSVIADLLQPTITGTVYYYVGHGLRNSESRSFNPRARLDRSSSAIYVHNAAEAAK